MTTLLVITLVIVFIATIVVVAMHPARTLQSRFELQRLHNEPVLRRERLLGGVLALQRVMVLLLVAILAVTTLLLLGSWSVLALPVGVLLIVVFARVGMVTKWASRFYKKHEPRLLRFIERNAWTRILMLPSDKPSHDQKLESQEQLLHLVEASSVFSQDQLAIIRHGLSWHTAKVSDSMQPRGAIVSVKHNELLGPLVLDDLHKSGHGQFPVIRGTIDTVVGILSIAELFDVAGSVASHTAEKAMSRQVVYVAADDTLPTALELLQKSKQHMLIVTDKDGKTVGLLTLADITGSLLGKTGVK